MEKYGGCIIPDNLLSKHIAFALNFCVSCLSISFVRTIYLTVPVAKLVNSSFDIYYNINKQINS
jgi:inner membrane protein involved in colicin E2 resistance